jgi:hypothetical protein
MKDDEGRIRKLEEEANACSSRQGQYVQTRALCEVARQLCRIADAFEEDEGEQP